MKIVLKIALWTLLGLLIIPFIVLFCLYQSADMGEPEITIHPSEYVATQKGDSLLCKNSYLKQDSSGLWELYVEGSGEERGAVQGVLTQDLMKYQEDVFVNKIREIIPSDGYLNVLRTFIIIFNRNLGECVPLEYREEIAAMSQFCTHDYDALGTPYQRQLNYHGAHDIGHTMQQYMLVGCSSFAAWGENTQDGSMVVGRNFDFYVGDDFAKNKLITFAVPNRGFRYASIGWAGMMGVLSGINEKGLTVTINAAKGAIPTTAATPISILVREILQYASTIDEAYRIAKASKTFVSESIMICSANDNRCVVIEKTPEETALFTPSGELLICTNHFQSKEFAEDAYNVENIEFSDSKYRYERLAEVLREQTPLNYKDAMKVLRNRLGKKDEDIGIGNEMTINQSIAHHAVVFMPKEKLMWVSTAPWQSGRVICYDLNGFFEGRSTPHRRMEFDIEADSLFLQQDYSRLINYRKGIKEIKHAMKQKQLLDDTFIAEFITFNPNHYYTYRILGDYLLEHDKNRAVDMYKEALQHTIPLKNERIEIEKLITK